MLERGLGQAAGPVGATWREMLMKLVVLQSTAGSTSAEADDAMKPEIQCVQTPWIPGFSTFRDVRGVTDEVSVSRGMAERGEVVAWG